MRLKWEKVFPLAVFLGAFAVLKGASIYGWVAFTLLGAKLLFSLLHKPATGGYEGSADHVVTVVVPVYNEDPELFVNCLRSIVAQTRRPHKIHVVDDGSSDRAAVEAARAVLADAERHGIRTELTLFRRNRGKREAQGVVFRSSPEATIFLTVDSDTVLAPEALEEGLKPFDDDRVMCVTGLVMALNNDHNLLTRLIHLRYVNAFMWERAAYSMLGSVLCACGSLALYRAEVIREHLDDFLSQRFLGKPAVFGDDRRLTNYALLHGRAVLQPSAVARTAVPERLRHFVRQQVRWNKSFIRESIWVLQNMPMKSTAFWLTFAEVASWAVFTVTLTVTLALASFHTGMSALGTYLILVCLVSYVRSAHYFSAWKVESNSRLSRLLTFAIAPIYGALHLLLLLPLRSFAALTLFSAGWGTRERVEVRVGTEGSTISLVAPDEVARPAPVPPVAVDPDAVWDTAATAAYAGDETASAARIEAAIDVWRRGQFEQARLLLEAEVNGPCDAIARDHLGRLRAAVERLSQACLRDYERRLVPGSEDWTEVRDGFLAWAGETVIGRPLPEQTPRSMAPALVVTQVEAVRNVRDVRVVSADAISKDWTRLALDVEVLLTGAGTVPVAAAGECAQAGDILRVLGMVDGDTVSVEWEGSALLRVTLEARIIAEPRKAQRLPAVPAGREAEAVLHH